MGETRFSFCFRFRSRRRIDNGKRTHRDAREYTLTCVRAIRKRSEQTTTVFTNRSVDEEQPHNEYTR